MAFQFFNPNAEVHISHGHLPHWEQSGATYFLTFRTADSIPTAVLQQWVAERALWLKRHGIDSSANDWQKQVELLPPAQRRDQSDVIQHRRPQVESQATNLMQRLLDNRGGLGHQKGRRCPASRLHGSEI